MIRVPLDAAISDGVDGARCSAARVAQRLDDPAIPDATATA
jgi:hypothetical protein